MRTMAEREFVCIACPNSCKLTVTEKDGALNVTGAGCKRGIEHGKNEFTNPLRMLTTTVAIAGGLHPRISVVSDGEIPKDKLPECLNYLYHIKLQAPVKRGDVVVPDICKTGVNILASRSMKLASAQRGPAVTDL